MSGILKSFLAGTGQTGNNTHTSVGAGPVSTRIGVNFIVEAVGATPTVTWKVQGSLDDTSIADGSSTWVDLIYVTGASDTGAQTALTDAAVGSHPIWLDVAGGTRFYRKYRLVTSANTNVTYRAELVQQYLN